MVTAWAFSRQLRVLRGCRHEGDAREEWHQPEEQWQPEEEWQQPEQHQQPQWRQDHKRYDAAAPSYDGAGEWHHPEQQRHPGWEDVDARQHSDGYHHENAEHGSEHGTQHVGELGEYTARRPPNSCNNGGAWVDHDAVPGSCPSGRHPGNLEGRRHGWDELEPLRHQRRPPPAGTGPPSSPESGEVEEEDGELPSESPAKRRRTDGADS